MRSRRIIILKVELFLLAVIIAFIAVMVGISSVVVYVSYDILLPERRDYVDILLVNLMLFLISLLAAKRLHANIKIQDKSMPEQNSTADTRVE